MAKFSICGHAIMEVPESNPGPFAPTVLPLNAPIPPVPQQSAPSPTPNGTTSILPQAPPQLSINKPTPPPQTVQTPPSQAINIPVIKVEDKHATLSQREPREKKDSWKKKEAKESTRKPTEVPPPSTPTTVATRLRPPPYRQEDINATPRLPTFTPAYSTTTTDGRTLEFFKVSDQPFNKKKFRYTPCAAAPELPQLMYRQISLPPCSARVNWQDMNPYVFIDKEGLSVTTEKGYRMARMNVCLREGEWYVEFKIERGGGDQGGHTRIGFARRESPP